jgi:hypothetical protein
MLSNPNGCMPLGGEEVMSGISLGRSTKLCATELDFD